MSAGGFVGRATALVELHRLVAEAASGRGETILIAGEPGIGKTRLATELARTSGVETAWGSCWDGEGAPALWPWIQVVRAVARLAPAVARDPILARLAPELGERDARDTSPPALDAQARFLMFDAVAAFLRAAADLRPMLIVLDDLHGADLPSLLLLRFCIAELRGARVAIVGTYRSGEVPPDHPLNELVAGRAGVVPLAGLSAEEVGELVVAERGAGPDPDAVEAILRATGGNPFFVRELLRAPDLAAIPDSVGEVIRRRAARLSAPARALLDAAAVVGPRGSLELIAQLVDPPAWTEVLAARLLEHDEPGAYRFPHALVHEVVYRDLAPDQRAQLHQRAGALLEERGAEPAELAHHFARAGDSARAIGHAAQAGYGALAVFGYEDAARQFERALAMLPTAERTRRAELSFALGCAHRAAGRTAEASAAFERVAQLSPPPELLAATALAFAVEFTAGIVDATEVRLLEQALDALPPDDHPLRARVLARLAKALLWSPSAARRAELGALAEAMARRIGDRGTLAAVLYDRHIALWGGPDVEARLAIAAEVVALAERCGDAELAVRGQALRIGNLLELGDFASAHVAIDAYDTATVRLRQPHYLWHVPLLRATLAAFACRFDAAEGLAREGLAIAQRAQHQAADVFHRAARATLRFAQGRFGELAPELRADAVRFPSVTTFRCALAFALTECGDLEQARDELERLAADRFAHLPHDFSRVANLALLSLTAAALGDRAAAAALYELLLPYERTCVRITRIGIGGFGAVAHYLGVLAAMRASWGPAVAHFERAIEANLRIGAPAFVARSRAELAGACAALGDTARAAAERRRAEVAASTLGFALRAVAAAPAPAPAPAPVGELRREGELWTLRYLGSPFRLRDSIGIGYVARLIAERGRELHVLDLSGGEDEAGAPILDARAKAALKDRLADLDDQVRDAEARGDAERAHRARDQIARLAEELARSVGIGGRDRRSSSEIERARTRVTKAVKATVRRIAEHDRAFADHLEHSLKTGAYCSYDPDPTAPVAWHVTM